MTERVRNPQDIRIVPTGAAPGGAQSTRLPPSNATAVQIFRLLASQAQGATASTSASLGDTSMPEQADTSAAGGVEPRHADAMPATPPEPQSAPAPPHAEPRRPTSCKADAASLRSHAHREGPKPDHPDRPEHDAALGKQIVHACAAAAHGELFTRDLADRIARFCATTGTSEGASWAVTLPLNAAVLPDTLLQLQFSPSSIAIRFETSDARSTQLISENADALRIRLADALGRRIDVQVSA